MDWMSIFSNEWFTGIVCGIISGIVVYWITTRAYSRKQSKEYWQRVKAANNEILYTMRRHLFRQPRVNIRSVLMTYLQSMPYGMTW